jgi:hypothetical protein
MSESLWGPQHHRAGPGNLKFLAFEFIDAAAMRWVTIIPWLLSSENERMRD